MNRTNKIMAAVAACMLLATGARADEGMWVLKN